MVVDIGGGTTDVVIYRSGSPWYTAVIPVGGNQLTKDLSVALGAPSYVAEELKIKFGHAMPDSIPSDEEVQLPGYQGQPRRTVKRRAMCQPLNERLTETLKLVLLKLRQAGLRQIPPGGLIITGGTAEIAGLTDLASRATGATVRIGYPRAILGLPSELRKPALSTGVGTLLWGIKHQGESRPYRNGQKTLRGHVPLVHRFLRRSERAAVTA
jgi:cell division protein FtsA